MVSEHAGQAGWPNGKQPKRLPVNWPCKCLMIGLALWSLSVANVLAQPQVLELGRWFNIANRDIDVPANDAVRELSSGMSDIILALDGGRRRGTAVEADLARRASASLQNASRAFEALSDRVMGHPIDMETIRKYGAEQQYYDLLNTLRQNGYAPPVDWKSYALLLRDVAARTAAIINTLIRTPPRDADAVRQAFLDLIAHKIILEKIGAASGIVTLSMQ